MELCCDVLAVQEKHLAHCLLGCVIALGLTQRQDIAGCEMLDASRWSSKDREDELRDAWHEGRVAPSHQNDLKPRLRIPYCAHVIADVLLSV